MLTRLLKNSLAGETACPTCLVDLVLVAQAVPPAIAALREFVSNLLRMAVRLGVRWETALVEPMALNKYRLTSDRHTPDTACNAGTGKYTRSADRLCPGRASLRPNPLRWRESPRRIFLLTPPLQPSPETPQRRRNKSATLPAARPRSRACGRRSPPSQPHRRLPSFPCTRTPRRISSLPIHPRCTMDKGCASGNEISPNTPDPRKYNRGSDCTTSTERRDPL